ncbi:MAG: hypothetical protein IJW45_01430 [Oscillospiraceae bacterium]|nr:hypothetical protein [Oscillospiraceae bacterium]
MKDFFKGIPGWMWVLIVIGGVVAVVWGRYLLMDVHPMTFVIFSPVILTVVAKIISWAQGDQGKMSREYKKRFPKNRQAYMICCALTCMIPVFVVVDEVMPSGDVLPETVVDIVGYIYLAVLAVAAVVWILTEVIRRDFPWGIFRLIERTVLLFCVCVGAYFVAVLIGNTVGPYVVYVAAILVPVLMIIASVMLTKLLGQLIFVIFVPDPEKRKQMRREADREEARRWRRERANWEKWEAAKPRNGFFQPYTVRDEDGYRREVRKTSRGTFVDKDGNEYKEIE